MFEADKLAEVRLAAAADTARKWLEQNQRDLVCDFCAWPVKPEEQVEYLLDGPVVAGISVLDPESLGAATVGFQYDPHWLACPACAEVIEQGSAKLLAAHVVAHANVARIGRRVSDDDGHYTDLYTKFFEKNPKRTEKPC